MISCANINRIVTTIKALADYPSGYSIEKRVIFFNDITKKYIKYHDSDDHENMNTLDCEAYDRIVQKRITVEEVMLYEAIRRGNKEVAARTTRKVE